MKKFDSLYPGGNKGKTVCAFKNCATDNEGNKECTGCWYMQMANKKPSVYCPTHFGSHFGQAPLVITGPMDSFTEQPHKKLKPEEPTTTHTSSSTATSSSSATVMPKTLT